MKPLDESQCREILEVSAEASLEDITLAYQLLKRIHGKDFALLCGSAMDEFSAEARAEALVEIEAAYRYLKVLGAAPGESQIAPRAAVAPVPDWTPPRLVRAVATPVAVSVPRPAPPVPVAAPAALPSWPVATTSLGKAREAASLSLDEVVEETHVPRAYLEALEEEEFDALRLPIVNVRGYLTAYVNAIGLPVDEVVPAYMNNFLKWQAGHAS